VIAVSKRRTLGEAALLLLGAMLGGGLAGIVEGAAFVYNDVGSGGGGPEAGGIVIFLPFILVVRAASGLAVGAGLGLALGLVPALVIAHVNASAPPRVKAILRVSWAVLVALPFVMLWSAPSILEPLLLSTGIVSELPKRPAAEKTHAGPFAVHGAHLDRATVPWCAYGTVVTRAAPPGAGAKTEVALTVRGPTASLVRPGQSMEVDVRVPGGLRWPVAEVHPAGAAGAIEAVARTDDEVTQPTDTTEWRGKVVLGTHEGWLDPREGRALFSPGDDFVLLEIQPTVPPRPGHGRIAQHKVLLGELAPDGRRDIVPLEGSFPDDMLVVVAGQNEHPDWDLLEGVEVTY
jgi:hypothetical protein